MSTRSLTSLLVSLLIGGCAGSSPPSDPALSETACTFDPHADVDCERACAGYATGFDGRAHDSFGEYMPVEACRELCDRFNEPAHHAQPDTVIHWNCLARHPMCSDEIQRCQQTCLDEVDDEHNPGPYIFCLPPEANSGS